MAGKRAPASPRRWAAWLALLAGLASAQAEPDPAIAHNRAQRSALFAMTATDEAGTALRGVVMETGVTHGAYTLVVHADGRTSLYFSTGGGIEDIDRPPALRAAARQFLHEAARHVPSGAASQREPPLPGPGRTAFHFLGPDGVRSLETDENELLAGRDPQSDLFAAAHVLLGEIRAASER